MFAACTKKGENMIFTPSMSWAAIWITELPTGMLSLTIALYEFRINERGWVFLLMMTVTVTSFCLLGKPLSMAKTCN